MSDATMIKLENVEVLKLLLALKKYDEQNEAKAEQTKEFYAGLNSEQQKAIDKIWLDLRAKAISEVEAEFRTEVILTPTQHDKLKELLVWHNSLVAKSSALRRKVQSLKKRRRYQACYQQPIESCS